MRGFLKNRSGGNQFLLVISIALVSFFIVGMIGTLVVAKMTGLSLGQLSDTSKWDFNHPQLVTAIRGMQVVQFIGLFIIPSALAAWLFSEKTSPYLRLQAPHRPGYWLAGIGIMLLAIPFSIWLGELNKQLPFSPDMRQWMQQAEDEANRTVKALLSRRSVTDLLLNLVFIAGLAAVGEELLFRGVLQRLLIKWFRSPWWGIIISAALFSAIHLQFMGFFPRLLLGILLGAIFWYSGSLWVAIAAHFVYDAVLIYAAWRSPEMLNDDTTVPATQLALAGTISFAAVVFLLEWIRRRSRTRFEEVYAADQEPFKDHPF